MIAACVRHAAAQAADAAQLERGAYLFIAADCMACHTDVKNKGALMAGGRALKTPFGTFYSPNITADPETGIGNWTDQDFIRALREGVSPEGPSPEFLRELAVRGSILDGVLTDFESHKTRVSAHDRQVIEAHLEHLRALEQELQNPAVCTPPDPITTECNGFTATLTGMPVSDEIR